MDTLGYLGPTHHEDLSSSDEDPDIKIVASNISTTASEAKVEMLPVMPQNNKMLFSGDYRPVTKVILLLDAKISKMTQEKLYFCWKCLQTSCYLVQVIWTT